MRGQVIVALLVVLPAVTKAQAPLPPGTRVRVMVRDWPNPVATGTLERATGDTLLIRGAPAPVVLSPGRYLQVSVARHRHTVRGMVYGLVGGAIVGAFAGGIAGAAAGSSSGCSGGMFCVNTAGVYLAGGLFIGAGAGLAIGAIIGSSSSEQWQTVHRGTGQPPAAAGFRVGGSVAAF